MKKIISLFLVLAISMLTIPVHAVENNTSDMNILESQVNADGEIIKEISTINGVYYYFEKRINETISIELSEKTAKVYVRDLSNTSEVSVGTVDLKDIRTNPLREIRKVSNDLKYGNIVLEAKPLMELGIEQIESVNEEHSVKGFRSSVADKIGKELEDEFGNEHTHKYLASKTYNGYTGYLYQGMSFYMTKKISWLLIAGSTVGLVMGIMSLPASTVMAIFFTTFSSATGVYSIVSDITSNKYEANVNYMKTVKVKDMYPYRAGKTVYNYAYVGDKAAALTFRKVSEHFDFDNNTGLIETGIKNYIEFN